MNFEICILVLLILGNFASADHAHVNFCEASTIQNPIMHSLVNKHGISADALVRFQEMCMKAGMACLMDREFLEERIEPIPDNVIGIAYHLYPVLIIAHSRAALNRFLGQTRIEIVTRGRLHMPTNRTMESVLESAFTSGVMVWQHPALSNLEPTARFVDPSDITNAITRIQSEHAHSHLVGFMSATKDMVRIDNGHFLGPIFLTHDNTATPDHVKIGEFTTTLKREARTTDNKFFYWVMQIRVHL